MHDRAAVGGCLLPAPGWVATPAQPDGCRAGDGAHWMPVSPLLNFFCSSLLYLIDQNYYLQIQIKQLKILNIILLHEPKLSTNQVNKYPDT